MKRILLLSLVASASLMASPFHCSDNPDVECSTDTLVIADQSSTNDIINNNARMDLSDGDKMALAGGEFIFNGDIRILNIPLGYNITQNIGIEAGIPLVNNSKFQTGITFAGTPIYEDNTGLGDVSVGANYHFGSYMAPYGLNVTTFRYKSTTGDRKKGLGTDYEAYTLSHAFAKELSFFELRTNALISYTLNHEAVLGNTLNAMIAASRPCLLTDKVRTNMKLAYRNIEEVTLNGSPSSAGYNNLDFWLEFNSDKLMNDIPVGLGVKVPIVDDVTFNGTTREGSKTFMFYVSLGAAFNNL